MQHFNLFHKVIFISLLFLGLSNNVLATECNIANFKAAKLCTALVGGKQQLLCCAGTISKCSFNSIGVFVKDNPDAWQSGADCGGGLPKGDICIATDPEKCSVTDTSAKS